MWLKEARKNEEEEMKKLFFVVMMVALVITLAQLKSANSADLPATSKGGGYIDSGCDPGNSIATFGFFYNQDLSKVTHYGNLFYSDHGCDTNSPLRNLRAEIIMPGKCAPGPKSINFIAQTDQGDIVYVFAKDNSGTGEADEFQIWFRGDEFNCYSPLKPVLAGKITVGKK
jgi:hypothetical protein